MCYCCSGSARAAWWVSNHQAVFTVLSLYLRAGCVKKNATETAHQGRKVEVGSGSCLRRSRALIVKSYPLGWRYDGYFHRWTVSSEANHDYDFHCVAPFYRAVLSTLRGLHFVPKSFLRHHLHNRRWVSQRMRRMIRWQVGIEPTVVVP